jgi:hypothetical protein
MFTGNIGWLSMDYTTLYPRRYNFSQALWELSHSTVTHLFVLIRQLFPRRTEKFAIVFKAENSIPSVFVLCVGSRLTNAFPIVVLLTVTYQRDKCVGKNGWWHIFRNSTIYHHDSFSVSFVTRETLIYMKLFPHSHTIQQLLAMMRHNRSRKRSLIYIFSFSLYYSDYIIMHPSGSKYYTDGITAPFLRVILWCQRNIRQKRGCAETTRFEQIIR